MKIQPNASPDEKTSPFFLANEAFCSLFESYIASKKGKVKGEYNAWSYLVFGKVTIPRDWDLMYKKASFSSGNLFFSPKEQSLLTVVEWKTDCKNVDAPEFKIRRVRTTDFIIIPLTAGLSRASLNDNYVIRSSSHNSYFIRELFHILEPLFLSGEVYLVEFYKGKLRIELRSDNHHFDVFDNLSSSALFTNHL